jgi:membrane-bound ClpP family serine protease
MPAFYAVALLFAFYALVVAEILIPSGGLLGLTAAVVAVTSIIIGSTYSFSLAVTLLLIYLVTTPLLFAILIRLWPKTRIGRMMLNRETLDADSTPPEPTTLDGTPLSELVGRIGTAASNLLPSGQVRIDGHKSDAVSTGLPIDAGTLVVVVRVYSGKLQVRAANETDVVQSQQQPATNVSGSVDIASQGILTPLANEHDEASGASSLDDVDFDELTR